MYVYLIRTLVLINPLTAKCMYMYVCVHVYAKIKTEVFYRI